MSKRILYRRKNTESVAPSERATIVPNAAPAVAKSTKMSAGAKLLVILLVAIAVVAIALLVINIIVNSYFSKINNQTPWYDEKIEISKPLDADLYEDANFLASDEYKAVYEKVLANYAEASHSLRKEANVYNYAIYGINNFGQANADTTAAFIMIASFNSDTNKVTYVTIAEDALVYIPHAACVGELRDAYEWGGVKSGSALLTKTIQHNFGIAINGYIEVNMQVVADLVDNAGGIEASIADGAKLNAAISAFNEKFDKQVANATVSNGKAKLSGEQALAYSRMGDAEMSSLVKALGKAIFQSGLGGMIDAFDIISENAKTAIVKDDFNALARMAVSTISGDSEPVKLNGTEVVWHYEIKVVAFENYGAESAKLDQLYK